MKVNMISGSCMGACQVVYCHSKHCFSLQGFKAGQSFLGQEDFKTSLLHTCDTKCSDLVYCNLSCLFVFRF